MINVNVDRLIRLKKFAKDDAELQNIVVQNVKSYVVENYNDTWKKYLEVKGYFESRIQGLTFNISGGRKKLGDKEFDFEPIEIEVYKNNQKENYNRVKLEGAILEKSPSIIYDEYLDVIVSNPDSIEKYHKSTWELVLDDALDKTYLCESGFTVMNNELLLFKDDKMYTIIDNIEANVQGVIVINLPDEIDESIIVVCIDKVILISDDCYYVDLGFGEKVVA